MKKYKLNSLQMFTLVSCFLCRHLECLLWSGKTLYSGLKGRQRKLMRPGKLPRNLPSDCMHCIPQANRQDQHHDKSHDHSVILSHAITCRPRLSLQQLANLTTAAFSWRTAAYAPIYLDLKSEATLPLLLWLGLKLEHKSQHCQQTYVISMHFHTLRVSESLIE